MGSAKSYILEVTGGTDSAGPAQYNYDLSQRRADAVVQYLAAKYNIAPHRFYLIGIGKDQYVADNNTPEGRKENRRVQVRLLSNMSSDNATSDHSPGSDGPGEPAQPAADDGGRIARTSESRRGSRLWKARAGLNGSALCVSVAKTLLPRAASRAPRGLGWR